MSVQEGGPQPADLLRQIEDSVALLDQAAQAHAEAIVVAAEQLGHVHHTRREITRDGEGIRTISDYGTPMAWLLGRRVPLTGVAAAGGKQAIRTVTAAALAAGGWHYPGRLSLLEQADESGEVRAVVERWQRRLIGEPE